jgi:hypothetical protein
VIPWEDIHRDLAPHFPDRSILVPTVAQVITAFLDRIIALLGDEKFQDVFLEKMSHVSSRHIAVRIGDQKSQEETCFDRDGKLALALPTAGPQVYRQMLPKVGNGVEAVFMNQGKQHATPTPKTTGGAQTTSIISEWVDVASAPEPKVTSLPLLDVLSRPEILFSSILPYYVIVTHNSSGIQIEGSHQPTMDLVFGYFQKHTRKNMNLTTQVSP